MVVGRDITDGLTTCGCFFIVMVMATLARIAMVVMKMSVAVRIHLADMNVGPARLAAMAVAPRLVLQRMRTRHRQR
jgi:hypothetical protein